MLYNSLSAEFSDSMVFGSPELCIFFKEGGASEAHVLHL